MSNSTFNVTEPDSSDSITLVVGTDGTVTPDKEIVQSYLSGRSTVDINLMRMKKVEAGKVNVTLDTLTYINSDDVEDFEEMDEIARNLLNFRMDHDYTPLTSPSHEKPRDPIEDELAQTLGLLEEGTLAPTPAPTPQQEPLTKITKIVKGKKQTIFVNSAQKAKMISSGMLKEKPAEVLFKKPKVVKVKVEEKKEEELEDIEDEEEEEEDEDDSDFELEEEEEIEREVKTRRRTRSGSERKRKEVKPKSPKKVEEVVKKEIEEVPVQEIKPPDKKITHKKEKKIAKPLPPDDFALFSTPDIIRRVGKEVASPEKAVSPPKPAKIQPDIRSKSSNELKTKRLSMEKERRLSLDSKKVQTGQVLVQDFSDTLNNSDSSIQDDQLQPLPSAEDIRAIIQNENTKSFTANLVIPDIPDPTLNLDEAGGLDLDQSILDNINTDMIPEDILMQVAQSLVDNTDLQNAIDKSIVDGNLVLDPAIQHISESALIQQQPLPNSEPLHTHPQQQAVAVSSTTVEEKDSPTKAGTQIVRPDGRVVVIPPIERPATRSRNKKKEISPIRQMKPVHKPLDDQHVSGNELDTSGEEADEEDEDESEDDPNKLWCICNQPHNNRFMICCDTCEEWYHGKCVNVTKAMGQMMEQEGKEWICVYCKDSTLQRPKAAARRIRKASRTSTDSGGGGGGGVKRPASTAPSSSSSSASLLDEKRSVGPGCVVCGKPSRNSSIYCSDTCILKHAQGVEKVVVFDRKSGKLLSGNNAPSAANLDKWLAQNPTFEVVRSTSKPSPAPPKPATMTQSKLRIIKNSGSEGVSLAVHKKGVNIGVLQHAPKDNNQSPPHILNSKQTPKKIVNITGLKIISKQSAFNNQAKIKVVPASPITPRPVLTSTPAKPPKMIQTKIITTMPSPKDKQQPQPQKTPKSRQAEVSIQPKQENLRETVRKTFFDQLSNRLKKVEDLVLTEEELKGISNEIESQLYKCFGDTGQKYKNKYRSLIFNIKDPKNQTLWRRICEKSVNPYQLVRLSPDDLASQELALWREREAKHQLDMIKKSELELLNCSRQFVFKTHKGEQVFEDDRPKDQVTEVISGLGADSTTEKDEEKEKEKRSSSRHKRDKSKDRGRDRSRSSKDSKERRKDRSSSKDRKKRSRSKDRGSSRHGDRKRSHSRDRHKRSSHRSSRHKKSDEKTIEKLDKKSKEILEQLVDKHIVPPLEDRLWKHVPQEDINPAANVESDSDHEPSSTVTIPTPPRNPEPDEGSLGKGKEVEKEEISMEADTGNKTPDVKPPPEPIWKGIINMIDVAQISITAHEVSGDCNRLGDELPGSLDIVGRISPDTVWDYIGKMKNSSGKTISVIRLTATNMEERMPYLALYSYLSSRNRLGVVKSVTKAVKDFYILPLAGNTPIPEPLLPLTGPGFEDSRPALLLGILVRDKRKRGLDSLSSHHHTKRVRVEMVIPGTPPSSSRSYTPPPSRDPRNKISSVPLPVVTVLPEEPPEEDMDEPYSPEDSDPDVLPEPSNSRLNASDISSLLTGTVKASSFLEGGLNTQSFEPFANKFDTIPGLDAPSTDAFDLQRKMAELDQRIAAQKAEIDKVSQDLVSSATDIGSTTLANIALPSNLQQILESIKTIGSKTDSVDSQGENSNSSLPPTTDLTIPLLLPKLSSRSLTGVASSLKPESTIPLNLPKSKPKAFEAEKPSSSVLSSLSEEDLIKKAAEMLGEEEGFVGVPPDPPIIGSLKARVDLTQPPIPGLDSD